MMKSSTYGLCAFCLLGVIAQAAAATGDAAALPAPIAPFVEAETIAVAHVDLSRIDWPKTCAALDALLPYNHYDQLGKTAKQMLDAGCKDVYVVATLDAEAALPVSPAIYVVLPLTADSDAKAVLAACGLRRGKYRVADGRLVILTNPARQWVLKPFDQFKAAARPELAAALAAAGDAAIQIAAAPPASSRRVIAELMPELPQEVGGGPITILTHGLLWATAGIDCPPQSAVRLTIQSADAQAAAALRAKLVEAADRVGKMPAVAPQRAKLVELAAALMPTVAGDRLVLNVDAEHHNVEAVTALFVPPLRAAQMAACRAQAVNNLKQIALALLNYESRNKTFPPPANYTPDGKPLLSWRVHVLPFLNQQALYKEFHLDESWDSEHNRKLIAKMPAVYRCPIAKHEKPGMTNYLAPVGHGAVFSPNHATNVGEIADGTANTILVLEVDNDQAVVWTKPDDWQYDPQNPLKGLGHNYDNIFLTAFCDGSVHMIHNRINKQMLQYLIECADKKHVNPAEF